MTLKRGDVIIVKVTKYYIDDDTRHPRITARTPAWVRGKYVEDRHWNIEGETLLIAPRLTQKEQDRLDWEGYLGLTTASGDEWEIVPEEQVPDKVWVAIAKRALLGEDDE